MKREDLVQFREAQVEQDGRRHSPAAMGEKECRIARESERRGGQDGAKENQVRRRAIVLCKSVPLTLRYTNLEAKSIENYPHGHQ